MAQVAVIESSDLTLVFIRGDAQIVAADEDLQLSCTVIATGMRSVAEMVDCSLEVARRINQEAFESDDRAQRLGRWLFDTFIRGTVRDLFFLHLGMSRANGRMLRLVLRFDQSVPQLAALSWELLCHADDGLFWSAVEDVSIVRHVESHGRTQGVLGTLPLRVVVATAVQASVTIDAAAHEAGVRNAFQALRMRGQVAYEYLGETEHASLAEKLRDHEPDLLHMALHGDFNDDDAQGALIFQDILRRPARMLASSMGALLRAHLPRLVVLVACDSAKTSSKSLLDGVAQQLVAHGVPAVIAMRHEIPESDGILLTERFYAAIAQGATIDRALQIARLALRARPEQRRPTWAVPALFTSSAERRLFKPPLHFGHPFAADITAIDELLKKSPQKALKRAAGVSLDGLCNLELDQLHNRIRQHERSLHIDSKVLNAYRDVERFLAKLIALTDP
ncbi:MAG: CHAT domain-containing protein [Acidobacteriota bacterium]